MIFFSNLVLRGERASATVITPGFLKRPKGLDGVFLYRSLHRHVIVVYATAVSKVFQVYVDRHLILFYMQVGVICSVELYLHYVIRASEYSSPVVFNEERVDASFARRTIMLRTHDRSILMIQFEETQGVPAARTNFDRRRVAFPEARVSAFLDARTMLLQRKQVIVIFSDRFNDRAAFRVPFANRPYPPDVSEVSYRRQLHIVVQVRRKSQFCLTNHPSVVKVGRAVIPSCCAGWLQYA